MRRRAAARAWRLAQQRRSKPSPATAGPARCVGKAALANLAFSLLFACGSDVDTPGGSASPGNEVLEPNPVGQPVAEPSRPAPDAVNSEAQTVCAAGTQWIYLIDINYRLVRFRPDVPSLEVLGEPDCPTIAPEHTPYAMSVSQNGEAWVSYTDQRIYRVSLSTLACRATSEVDNEARIAAGRGFATLAFFLDPQTGRERIFTLGSDTEGGAVGLPGYIDPETERFTSSEAAGIEGSPEITGNRAGRLFGFAPPRTSPEARVLEISPSNFAVIAEQTLLGLEPTEGNGILTWAFANWDGWIYFFWKPTQAAESSIYRIAVVDIREGSSVRAERIDIDALGLAIVGAGVSICAPAGSLI